MEVLKALGRDAHFEISDVLCAVSHVAVLREHQEVFLGTSGFLAHSGSRSRRAFLQRHENTLPHGERHPRTSGYPLPGEIGARS